MNNDFSTDYAAFLESDTWQTMRQKRLAIDNYKCQFCGSGGSTDNPLQIHHFGYKNACGSEDVFRDLVTACRRCHTLIHNGMNRVTNEY